MKKTVNVSIGKQPFIIEEEAFETLKNYLMALRKRFTNEEEREEVIMDIEVRIAELISSKRVLPSDVTTKKEVDYAISVLGKPEDIFGETEFSSPSESSSNSNQKETAKNPINKRLFRNPDDKKIGGVISGLCLYFGIEDPTWARLIAVLMFFASFTSLAWIYIILMIVVPEAQTPSEKLQMRGDDVNVKNIEKVIKDTFDHASNAMNSTLNGKQGNRNFFESLLAVILGFAKLLVKVFAAILLVGLFFTALGIGFSAIGLSAFGFPSMSEIRNLFLDSTFTYWGFIIGMIMLVLVPIIFLIYLLMRFIVGGKSSIRNTALGVLITAISGLILVLISAYDVKQTYSSKNQMQDALNINQPLGNTLLVSVNDTAGLDIENIDFNSNDDETNISVNGVDWDDLERVRIGNVTVSLVPVAGDSFTLQRNSFSRGKNKNDALNNLKYISYKYMQKDSQLILDPGYELDKKGKWRNQRLRLVIGVPKNKSVCLSPDMNSMNVHVQGWGENDGGKGFGNSCWSNQNGSMVQENDKVKEITYSSNNNKNEEPW